MQNLRRRGGLCCDSSAKGKSDADILAAKKTLASRYRLSEKDARDCKRDTITR